MTNTIFRFTVLLWVLKWPLLFGQLVSRYFENKALAKAPFKPYIWLRYIDDIFMIWTEGPENFKVFVEYLNNIHPSLTTEYTATVGNLFLRIRRSLKIVAQLN